MGISPGTTLSNNNVIILSILFNEHTCSSLLAWTWLGGGNCDSVTGRCMSFRGRPVVLLTSGSVSNAFIGGITLIPLVLYVIFLVETPQFREIRSPCLLLFPRALSDRCSSSPTDLCNAPSASFQAMNLNTSCGSICCLLLQNSRIWVTCTPPILLGSFNETSEGRYLLSI